MTAPDLAAPQAGPPGRAEQSRSAPAGLAPGEHGFRLMIPWWFHPLWIAAIFVALLPISAALIPTSAFTLWKTPRYIDATIGMTGFLSGLSLLVGLAVFTLRVRPGVTIVRVSASAVARLRAIAVGAFVLALFGYGIWIALSFLRGTTVTDFVNVITLQEGAISALKKMNPPVAGITTFTQLGPVAAGVMMMLRRMGVRAYTWQMVVLVALAVYRSFFYGERLAIIEVGLPLIFLYFAVQPMRTGTAPGAQIARGGPIERVMRKTAPFFAIPAIWGLFAVFEYSRSWLYYRNIVTTSFTEYISTRLAGYYVTTANNSAMYHAAVAGKPHDPYYSFAAVWDGPGMSMIAGRPEIAGLDPQQWWKMMLENSANPEFNNQGTFLITDADLGTPLSMLYWFLLGLAVGYLFYRATQGSLVSLLAYSLTIMGLLEVSRIIYWSQGRFIPILLALLVIAVLLPGPKRREIHASG
ncbi:hypothetical protein [Gordonia sp. i37]|uniref:hypothetical protein n=1 Tax=Gordonia sp. i37 TaxID=1961707 RepID=UPI0009AE7F21|nr:hypothetical protein [Gordonia sp. i37]OPX07460.1 hypothetical protein B1964_27830 [Gordonia sp. i37]